MMRLRLIIPLLIWAITPAAWAAGSDAFDHLDSLIAKHAKLVEAKKQRIETIKTALHGCTSMEKEYNINNRLCNEYAEFQNDSAQHYARRNIALAHDMASNTKLNDSRLKLMHLLAKAYMPEEIDNIATKLDTASMTVEQKLEFYKQMADVALFKLEFYKGSASEKDYQEQLTQYRHLIAKLSPQGSERQLLYRANYLNDTGDTRQAIALLEDMLKNYHSGDRTFSVITSSLAFYYGTLGNRDKQKQLLALSAASDIEGCIMENSALRQLADLLFDDGDIDRAYRYINLSVADATFYGTRLRNVQASQLVPRIIDAYESKQEKNYRQLLTMIITLSLLAALLVAGVIALAMLYKRYRRLSLSRKAINDQLNDTVMQLRERDKIKEQYLGRFLALSSKLIDQSEKQRKTMNRLAMEDNIKELKLQLKSPHFDYENAQLFYRNFDSAFLNIYPTFIERVNALLIDGEQIVPKDDEQLTRELRILALLRLGITDNKEIASILRASISTVYTYRSRLKARAINKETFEDDVKQLRAEE